MFLRFSGIDFDNDDDAGQKLDTFIRRVQKILSRYEGHLLQLTIGDKGSYLYASYGAPVAHEDDMSRAVAAALDLRNLPLEMYFITEIQIGLSQGRMYTGAYGGSMRRTYGVLGDEVNLSARLMQHAQPGQILVKQHIADLTADQYNFQSIGQIKVKGYGAALSLSLTKQ